MSEAKKHVYTANIPLRWCDMDAFGHINGSVYFSYIEQARVMWWEMLGYQTVKQDIGPVIVTAECQFLKQMFYPGELDIKVYVSKPSRASYMIYYDIGMIGESDVIYATASTKVVWVDYKAGKSVRLPDEMKALL